MKIKTGVNFHNRFDVVKNGEWVGYAENIILDQMYGRLCSFNTYFVNIHFGTGSGSPTPERTSLFTHLGTKVAVDEEMVIAFPTSKRTRKITLMPEEYVGATITEVGIAYSTTATHLVTHAMIKDAEGNPLSITKSNLDVIEIYATVFITLVESEYVKYVTGQNALLNYFMTTSAVAPDNMIMVGAASMAAPGVTIADYVAHKTATRTADVVARKVTYTTRFGITEANNIRRQIKEVALAGVYRYIIPTPTHAVANIPVGLGDGVTSTFVVPNEGITDLKVFIDQVETTDFVYTPGHLKDSTRSLLYFCDIVSMTDENKLLIKRGYGINGYNLSGQYQNALTCEYILKCNSPTAGKKFKVTLFGGGYSWLYSQATVLGSNDEGDTWTQLFTNKYEPTAESNVINTIAADWDMLKINLYTNSTHNYTSYVGVTEVTDSVGNVVTFNTPPPVGAVITANYNTPYYPKDPDYVLDVEFELQFGEGA
jgi:hypothetical protein